MLNKIQGQWFRSDLLLCYYPEIECYRLISRCYAYSFHRAMAARKILKSSGGKSVKKIR